MNYSVLALVAQSVNQMDPLSVQTLVRKARLRISGGGCWGVLYEGWLKEPQSSGLSALNELTLIGNGGRGSQLACLEKSASDIKKRNSAIFKRETWQRLCSGYRATEKCYSPL